MIEINTDAGGAMLNAVLARAQRACCAVMDRSRPLGSIAIVDNKSEQPYFCPEFLLFQPLFERLEGGPN